MPERKRAAFSLLIRQLASRRVALWAAAASLWMAETGRGLNPDGADAKRRRKRHHKKRKRCKGAKAKCRGKCRSLQSDQDCGQCGNRCAAGTSCQDGVCCAFPLCRSECRPDCLPPNPAFPFPQHVDYANAIYPTNRSDQHVWDTYDAWKARYLVREDRDANSNQVFRIALGKPGTDNHHVTVSEGQGYGLIIVATMAGHDEAAQEIFDGLWRFRLAHPSTIDPRLMDWRVPSQGGDDSAFDGDADIAYGLLLADAQWGSAGQIDYIAAFQEVIAGIKESTIGPQSKLPMLGDWVDANGGQYNQNTPRTSDFMPGHFRAFRAATGDADWDAVVVACQGVINELQDEFSPGTGLLPDFAVRSAGRFQPAPPGFLEGPNDGSYNYNAGRDPWRLGTDALLNGDAMSAAQAGKIATWAEGETGGDPHNLRSGYRLDGTPLPGADYFSTFFAAPIGVAAMTTGELAWLDAIYGAVSSVQEDYYEDTVTLLCLLVMSGNFWAP